MGDDKAACTCTLNSHYDRHNGWKDTDSTQRLSGMKKIENRQAFWLKDHSTDRAFPVAQWRFAAFVPSYSNGWLAMDSNHLSF